MSKAVADETCGADTSDGERCELPVSDGDRCHLHADNGTNGKGTGMMDRTEYKKRKETLESEINQLRDRIDEINQQFNEELAKMDPDEDRAEQLQQDRDTLQRELERKQTRLEKLETSIFADVQKSEALEIIDQLTDRASEIKDSYEEATEGLEDLADEVEERAKTILTSYRKMDQVKIVIENLSREHDLDEPESLPNVPSPGNDENRDLVEAIKDRVTTAEQAGATLRDTASVLRGQLPKKDHDYIVKRARSLLE